MKTIQPKKDTIIDYYTPVQVVKFIRKIQLKVAAANNLEEDILYQELKTEAWQLQLLEEYFREMG